MVRFSLALGLVSACSVLFFPALSYPADVTIAWSPSTDPKVLGYKVYYGPSGRENEFQADARAETKITLTNLQEGASYSFTVFTYDLSGQEDRYSYKTTVLSLKDQDTHFLSILASSPPTPSIAPGPPGQERAFPGTPPGCEFVISLAPRSIGSEGGTLAVAISTKLNCPWIAMANVPWVTLTSNDKGTGSQVVYCLVKPNSSLSSREGTLTVADRMLKITQAGLRRYPLHLAKIGTGTGTIASFPAGTDFERGTFVALSAVPGANSDFAGWSGRCSGTSPNCSVAITAGTTVKANFKLKTFVIAASAGANGSITPSGRIVVGYGASQKFIFKPNKGYRIGQIRADGKSAGNSEVLLFGNIMSSHKISVIFTPRR